MAAFAGPMVRIRLSPAQSQERTVGDASGAGVEEVPGVAGLGHHLGMRREHLVDGVVGPHRYFQHTSEIFKTRIKQMPEVAVRRSTRRGAAAEITSARSTPCVV
jgi:hypothetical protein